MENRIIAWRQPLGRKECPYCYRWVLNLGLFAIRVHKWIASDDTRYMHDDPYWSVTCVLSGSYYDVTDYGKELMSAGTVRFRRAQHKHYVQVVSKPCWTILISGMFVRQWGFWVKNKFMRRENYFRRYGHICDKTTQQNI